MIELLSLGLLLVLASVGFKVCAQIILKQRLNVHGAIPWQPMGLIRYALNALLDQKLLAGVVLLLAGAFCWFAALSRLDLSYAFPISALSYPLILVSSAVFLKEQVTPRMVVGNLSILAGIVIVGVSS
ncbi:MAG: EamA family transporter [Pseudomonadales bacterium]|nr:EamA family transporter [Pseudomonadales bacterium]